jgi:hypothetical protein
MRLTIACGDANVLSTVYGIGGGIVFAELTKRLEGRAMSANHPLHRTAGTSGEGQDRCAATGPLFRGSTKPT